MATTAHQFRNDPHDPHGLLELPLEALAPWWQEVLTGQWDQSRNYLGKAGLSREALWSAHWHGGAAAVRELTPQPAPRSEQFWDVFVYNCLDYPHDARWAYDRAVEETQAAWQLALPLRDRLSGRPIDEAALFHDAGAPGFFAVLTRRGGADRPDQRSYRLDQLPAVLGALDPQNDAYISQAEFFRPNRRVVNLWRIGLCFVDLDTYNSPYGRLPLRQWPGLIALLRRPRHTQAEHDYQ